MSLGEPEAGLGSSWPRWHERGSEALHGAVDRPGRTKTTKLAQACTNVTSSNGTGRTHYGVIDNSELQRNEFAILRMDFLHLCPGPGCAKHRIARVHGCSKPLSYPSWRCRTSERAPFAVERWAGAVAPAPTTPAS